MKSILMSIKPQHVANILNGLKTIEVRKRFPSDYVGWVYIYCTKGKLLAKENNGRFVIEDKNTIINERFALNGTVIARFWCDKVEEIRPLMCGNFYHIEYGLTTNQLNDYLNGKKGYAIHITKLEIFDKPKEISELKHTKLLLYFNEDSSGGFKEELEPLTRAPQSWCYIEV